MQSKQWVWLTVGLFLAMFSLSCTGCGEEPAPDETPVEESAEVETAPPEVAPEPAPAEAGSDITYPVIEMTTSLGTIKLELYPDKAPKTVENFLSYVRSGFFDGTIFHRVVPDFVIQGGGFTADMTKKDTEAPIENEADNGLLNGRGTICMARTNDPHSATSQFFINTKDNPPLDHRDKSSGWGYAVFGKITEGLDVVDAIEAVPTTTRDGYRDVPVEPVLIETARIIG